MAAQGYGEGELPRARQANLYHVLLPVQGREGGRGVCAWLYLVTGKFLFLEHLSNNL